VPVSRYAEISGKIEMSQKDVWKDNRTITPAGIAANEQHWLSSVAVNKKLANETAGQPRQKKDEEGRQ
jgi:hypothetical protein